MWFKNGLKAQKLLAQGIALGIMAISKTPCKGKSFISIAFAFTGRLYCTYISLSYGNLQSLSLSTGLGGCLYDIYSRWNTENHSLLIRQLITVNHLAIQCKYLNLVELLTTQG